MLSMEQRILINEKLSATFVTPVDNTNPLPAVLFFHGFASNQNEVGDTFSLVANKLAQEKIASLRFDFSYCRDNNANSANMTMYSLISDAELALNYLINLSVIDKNRIGLCGFSLGAAIAFIIATKYQNLIKTIVVISPVADLVKNFKSDFGCQYLDLEMSASAYKVDLGWSSIYLKNSFIHSLKDFPLLDISKNYKEAILAIAGTDDNCHHDAEQYILNSKSDKKQLVSIWRANHIFFAYDKDKSSISKVVHTVTEWFKPLAN